MSTDQAQEAIPEWNQLLPTLEHLLPEPNLEFPGRTLITHSLKLEPYRVVSVSPSIPFSSVQSLPEPGSTKILSRPKSPDETLQGPKPVSLDEGCYTDKACSNNARWWTEVSILELLSRI